MKRMSRLSKLENSKLGCDEWTCRWMTVCWHLFSKISSNTTSSTENFPRSSTLTQPHTPGSTHYPLFLPITYHPWNALTCLSIPSFLACLSYIRRQALWGWDSVSASLTAPPSRQNAICSENRCRAKWVCVPLKGSLLSAAVRKEKHVQVPKFWGWEELGVGIDVYTLWVLHIK